MVNEKGQRELVYPAQITDIRPIKGYDKVEQAFVGGWSILVKKNQFNIGDWGIFFEIDSKVPEIPPFEFLEKRHYKIKTIRMCGILSQGLLMAFEDFDGTDFQGAIDALRDAERRGKDLSKFWLTNLLKVKYAAPEDNKRKDNFESSYRAASQKHPKIAKSWIVRKLKKYMWFRKLFTKLFNTKKKGTKFPTHFPYIKPTDQERCENMISILQDKTPYIITQKCDGSSATYILERKPFHQFEFYVCSRHVRQLTPNQKSYYEDNYYWDCAIKYDIKNKLKDYLQKHPDLKYICWQGEICAPKIQKNPHNLKEPHLFCFHMIDSKIGRYDIRDAVKIWKEYSMETVPIIDEKYILPDNFEDFKKATESFYVPSVCEGATNQPCEGWVLYKTTEPSFSFKNVSRKYLLNH